MSNYFVYITTNSGKTTLYVSITNDLLSRMKQHKDNPKSLAGRYFCYKLINFERYNNVIAAIEREKEIKDLSRKNKETLINSINPRWEFYDPFDLN